MATLHSRAAPDAANRDRAIAEGDTVSRVKVLMVGLDPSLADESSASKFSHGASTDELLAVIRDDEAELRLHGYDPSVCLIRPGLDAEAAVEARLERTAFDCVLIGAGLRLSPQHTILFENVVNSVREKAPRATLCFNDGPRPSVGAVRRWFPSGTK